MPQKQLPTQIDFLFSKSLSIQELIDTRKKRLKDPSRKGFTPSAREKELEILTAFDKSIYEFGKMIGSIDFKIQRIKNLQYQTRHNKDNLPALIDETMSVMNEIKDKMIDLENEFVQNADCS